SARTRLDISALQDRNPLYVRLSDGSVRNNYTVKIRNMEARPRDMEISLSGLPGAVLWAEGESREQAARSVRVTVPADSVAKSRVYIALPAEGPQRTDFAFTVRALDREGGSSSDETHFERPEASQ
ncbi:MAG TPA: FixG Ig-like domain-containing protein, partial [Rhizorhapis sp.]|nr:FixG Ig-like domain-containing protein [Rhizorhapis sp.]